VADVNGFSEGQTITIDAGANLETAVIHSVSRWGGATITVAGPISHAHSAGAQLSGSGITLTAALMKTHSSEAQVSDNLPTPGTPNQYYQKGH